MPKQIDRDIAQAFKTGKPLRRSNTHCTGDEVYLHGSRIAWRDEDGEVWVTLAGYNTLTTLARVNAILIAFDAGWGFYRCRDARAHFRVSQAGTLGRVIEHLEREMEREAA